MQKRPQNCTGRRLVHWSISIENPISSTPAKYRTENSWKTCTACVKITSFLTLRTNDTHLFQVPPNWCRPTARNYEIVQNVSLQSAGCLPSTETKSQKMSKISTKVVVHKSQYFNTSFYTVWNRCPSYIKKKKKKRKRKEEEEETLYNPYFLDLRNVLAWI